VKQKPRRLLFLIICTCLVVPSVAWGQAEQIDPNRSEVDKLAAALEFVRRRNARDYAIITARGIDEAKYVKIGGIEQWITIRGQDRNSPVLLFLHGGPGDATNPWGYALFRSWLKHFTVVQWDQRGAGRTLGRNGQSVVPTITIDRMSQDGIELAELLRKYLKKPKLILVAHSFGSILGLKMVRSRPDLFYAFVGTGQIGDSSKNYAVAYRDLMKKAVALGDQVAIDELRRVGPPPYSDGRGYSVQRKWSNQFEHADIFISSMLGLALVAPGYSPRDVNEWFEGQGLSAERLIPETSKLRMESLGGSFSLPIFVIQGAEDFTTPTSLARALVESIRAPSKAFVQIEGGGHFAVFMKADAFLQVLVSRVLPLTRVG
jgi:pimeloyl-ACP methyl ester carboxylesterase